ncbi:MAG: alpha-galactosidase [Bacteroidales bacterium]|nr:alpha-galactosidase [Bacteroidales bacterium]MCF8389929.1 alpha-galactosidase [Bacteroidales bacterium]
MKFSENKLGMKVRLKSLNIFILLCLLAFPKALTGQEMMNENECYGILENDTLIIGNSIIKRVYLWNAGDIISLKIEDLKNKTEFYLDGQEPDFHLPGTELSGKKPEVKNEWIAQSKTTNAHLEFSIITHYSDLSLKRIFSIYPESPAIQCELYLMGKYDGIQASEIKKKRFESAYIERIAPFGQHWKLKSITFFDETDNNNNLIIEEESLVFSRQIKLKANLIFARNLINDIGFFILKEGPSYPAQINYPGFDFLASATPNHFLNILLAGPGFDNKDIVPDKWIKIYGFASGISRGDWESFSKDLRIYQKNIRNRINSRDEMIMMNTWGDRGQDSIISEAFILKELKAASKLGITHFQIDDGWQTGRTKNSAFSGGSLENIWQKGNYWEPDKEKFPDGLEKIVTKAWELEIQLGLWFNPSADSSYKNWQRDANVILSLYLEYDIRYFKIDGLIIPDKLAETNFRAFLEEIIKGSDGNIVINLDVTGVAPRPGYHYFNEYGNIFLENRYTDWGNYYPHWTLRNLWMLSSYIPPENIQIEFLNKWRNSDMYLDDDPLAPNNIPFNYQFATTMAAQPLAWFEGSNLPEEAFDISSMIKAYKVHMAEFHKGIILPIGDEPSGLGWTGFQSISENEGYFLIYREFNDNTAKFIKIQASPGSKISLQAIAGQANDFETFCNENSEVCFSLAEKWNFAFYKYTIQE